jgi:hypothetical protein
MRAAVLVDAPPRMFRARVRITFVISIHAYIPADRDTLE